jgi:hypothetical protein
MSGVLDRHVTGLHLTVRDGRVERIHVLYETFSR